MAVGDQFGQEIDGEVCLAPVPRMLDLKQGLELVKHSFYQGAAPEDNFFMQEEQAICHIAFQVCYQAHAARLQELARQRLRKITLIPEQASPYVFRKFAYWAPIVDIAWGELAGEEFAVMVDDNMELKAIEPAERGLAPLGDPTEHAMLPDTPIVAHGKRRRVNEREAGASA